MTENNNLEFGCFAAITCYTDDVMTDSRNKLFPLNRCPVASLRLSSRPGRGSLFGVDAMTRDSLKYRVYKAYRKYGTVPAWFAWARMCKCFIVTDTDMAITMDV